MKKGRLLWSLLTVLPVGLVLFFHWIWGEAGDGAGRPTVRVYTYSSFMSPWGPGPELAAEFEKRTGVAIQLVDGGDSQALVERLRFRSPREVIDVVLGLDQLALSSARRAVTWQKVTPPREVLWAAALPENLLREDFLPVQWAPLSFIHRGAYAQVTTLPDLLDPKFAKDLLLLDPRTSTPGFQFLNWVVGLLGEEGAVTYLRELKASVHSVQSSWSAAYSLFRQKEAGAIFTYVTSVYYHWQEEGDRSYQPVAFREGLPVQVEFAGVPEGCQQCDSAAEFIRFLLEPASQKLMVEKNYMLPVVGGVFTPEWEQELSLAAFDFEAARDLRHLLGLWQRAGL